MSTFPWIRNARAGHAVAATAVILAAGGLVLLRSAAATRGRSAGATAMDARSATSASPAARRLEPGAAGFAGPGAHGSLALSHSRVLAGGERRIFLDVRLEGDARDREKERAPLSLAVVLDHSGSMEGEKLDQARSAVIRLVRDMRDDDEISVVAYDEDSTVIQRLAPVGEVRARLIDRLGRIRAGGGTSIPTGLTAGLATLREAGRGRVRRVVLVSDGLDGSRAESTRLAQQSFEGGVTTSSLGIGLDFDEGYLGALAGSGHGNFGFVKEASSLSGFLARELEETASTTVEHASVHLTLPKGVRFVRAFGADAGLTRDAWDARDAWDGQGQRDGEVDLKLGALFAGDERRALVELATTLAVGDVRALAGSARWTRVGGEACEVPLPLFEVVATDDAKSVEASRNGAVFARVTSVLASERQLAANDAYAKGDTAKADGLVAENVRDLDLAAKSAPPKAKAALEAQRSSYESAKKGFGSIAPASEAGRAMTKSAAAKEIANVGRGSY